MIKAGICYCDTPRAAELLRVLINHPDVELRWAARDGAAGVRVDSIVPGLIGECDLETIDIRDADVDGVDVVFACGAPGQSHPWQDVAATPDDEDTTRWIDLSDTHGTADGDQWTLGMPEMMRRVLVHDCYRAWVPGAGAIASLLTLLPLARNLLLTSPVTLRVAVGQGILPCVTGGMDTAAWLQQQQQQVADALAVCQASFAQPLQLDLTTLRQQRVMAVAARVRCGVSESMLRELYEQYYDDHNFVFIVDRTVGAADIENTNKCLLRLVKDDRQGTLTVYAVMDAWLKGCAGTAVHVMNLMFGLHERVGLQLKATGC